MGFGALVMTLAVDASDKYVPGKRRARSTRWGPPKPAQRKVPEPPVAVSENKYHPHNVYYAAAPEKLSNEDWGIELSENTQKKRLYDAIAGFEQSVKGELKNGDYVKALNSNADHRKDWVGIVMEFLGKDHDTYKVKWGWVPEFTKWGPISLVTAEDVELTILPKDCER